MSKLKKGLLGASFTLAACGGAESLVESAPSPLFEMPTRGEWAEIGRATFRIETEPREFTIDPAEVAELEAKAGTEGAEALEALTSRELDEGDRAILVDPEGKLFSRIDQLRLAGPIDVREFGLGGPAPGEVGDLADKDVFGSDDRTLISNTTGYPYRAHAALRSSPNATQAFCSGAMIGPRHLLTAGHCLYRDGAFTKNRADLRIVWGQNGSGNDAVNTPVQGKRGVVAWVIPKGWIEDENRKYDYALVILDDATYSPGWLGFKSYSWTTLTGLNVNINGYPGHGYTCAASPRADKLCGGYLYHGYGAITYVVDGLMGTWIDWEKGNSGSAVYRYTDGSRYVVGVATASSELSNTITRVRDGVADSLCTWIGDYPSSHFSHNCQ